MLALNFECFYVSINESVQILLHLLCFVQDAFKLDDCFHVHFIYLHQSIFVVFKDNGLILFLGVYR